MATEFMGATGAPAVLLWKLAKFPPEAWDEGGVGHELAAKVRGLVKAEFPDQFKTVDAALVIIEATA